MTKITKKQQNASDQPKEEDRGALDFNQSAWDAMARAGDRFYCGMTPAQISAAKNGEWKVRVTPQKAVPREWLEPIAGKKLLCLAGGGGQQAPLLAAAGARVTVFDLSTAQLDRDRAIAAREGLDITTVAGDIADLRCFDDEQFELILNPCSVCYCTDVKPIWSECYRVLNRGGILITGFINPLYYLFDAVEMDRNKFVVRHKIPYSDFDLPEDERERILGNERPREYGHTLDDLIGEQLAVGFLLTGFYEDGWGDGDRLSSMINLFCATRALKI